MANPFATATEIKVLKLLEDEVARYGLELIRLSRGELKRGTIYVILHRLEERGLVKSVVPKRSKQSKPKHSGLPRPLYSITEAGVRMLKAWEQVTNEDKLGNAH